MDEAFWERLILFAYTLIGAVFVGLLGLEIWDLWEQPCKTLGAILSVATGTLLGGGLFALGHRNRAKPISMHWVILILGFFGVMMMLILLASSGGG